jgi:chromosome segregation ATPase
MPTLNVGPGRVLTDILSRDLASKGKQVEEMDMQLQDSRFQIQELEEEISDLQDELDSQDSSLLKVQVIKYESEIKLKDNKLKSLIEKNVNIGHELNLQKLQLESANNESSQFKTHVIGLESHMSELIQQNKQLLQKVSCHKS